MRLIAPWHSFHVAEWNGATVGILIAYICAMLSLYTVAPLLFRAASSPFYNLSLLASNFWSLCFGLGLVRPLLYVHTLIDTDARIIVQRPRILDLWSGLPNGHCWPDHLLLLSFTRTFGSTHGSQGQRKEGRTY